MSWIFLQNLLPLLWNSFLHMIWSSHTPVWLLYLCSLLSLFLPLNIVFKKDSLLKAPLCTSFLPSVTVLCHQPCPILCDPVDCSSSGFSVHEILQARILGWVVMPSSRESPQPRDRTYVSCVSCISGGLFTAEPPRKPLFLPLNNATVLMHSRHFQSSKRSPIQGSGLPQASVYLSKLPSPSSLHILCFSQRILI